ncbi:glycoside hydrolase [Phaeosphaeria sp. MPI-PUGE-AT-0046c]|nr:glycoside hydrolase [Phaeosphaeria sp. MPI-PUGE-AT-0046c]
MVETLARFGIEDAEFKQAAIDIVSNTYDKSRNQMGAKDWKNDFYDDMGWWAMAWIASFDLTGDVKYLDTAKDLFEDMTGGWTTPCNGGLWWDKKKQSIAAISNELFLVVGASLANRASGAEKQYYVDWAQMEWDWFWNSGIINEQGLINDGIDQTTCENDGKTTFTYNQGVILAGLSEMGRAKSDGGFIGHAYDIAYAAMARLTDNGILNEPVGGPLDDQGAQFKGVFARGLSTLNENEPQQSFTDFLKRNAASVWRQEKVDGGVITDKWQGGSRNANTASHAAGIDILVAAALVE